MRRIGGFELGVTSQLSHKLWTDLEIEELKLIARILCTETVKL